jgi:hypothetical protein
LRPWRRQRTQRLGSRRGGGDAGYGASSSSLLASAALAEINETTWSRRGSAARPRSSRPWRRRWRRQTQGRGSKRGGEADVGVSSLLASATATVDVVLLPRAATLAAATCRFGYGVVFGGDGAVARARARRWSGDGGRRARGGDRLPSASAEIERRRREADCMRD